MHTDTAELPRITDTGPQTVTLPALAGGFRNRPPVPPAPAAGATTRRLPPLTATVRRRPPVPAVVPLAGSELLAALMAELDRDDDR